MPNDNTDEFGKGQKPIDNQNGSQSEISDVRQGAPAEQTSSFSSPSDGPESSEKMTETEI